MSILSELGVRHGKNRKGEEFLYNLASCYSHVERVLERLLAPLGLSPVKMNALMIIKHAGGGRGLPQREIAARMIVSAGNVTRLIDRLERDGLVRRGPSADDRRVKVVHVTDKASALLDRIWPDYQKSVSRIVSVVSENDLTACSAALDRFRKSISHIAKEGVR